MWGGALGGCPGVGAREGLLHRREGCQAQSASQAGDLMCGGAVASWERRMLRLCMRYHKLMLSSACASGSAIHKSFKRPVNDSYVPCLSQSP